jgi:hypothetical protein
LYFMGVSSGPDAGIVQRGLSAVNPGRLRRAL